MAITAGAHAVIFRGNPTANATPVQANPVITAQTADERQKVEFDHVLLGVDTWEGKLERFKPNVPDPNAEAPIRPDTGLNTVSLTLHCTARRYDVGLDPDERDWHPVERLKRWAARSATLRGRYDEGRFGLWFAYERMYNHAPGLNGGYKIVGIMDRGNAQWPSVQGVDIMLEYSGAALRHDMLGVAPHAT